MPSRLVTKSDDFIWAKHLFDARVIADELLARFRADCGQFWHRDVSRTEVAEHEQMLTRKLALIGEHIIVLSREEMDGALCDDAMLLAQCDELAVEGEDGVRILLLALDVDGSMVTVDAEPRRARGEAGRLACRPLHRRAAVVARTRFDDLHRLRLRQPRLAQDVVVV